MLAVIFPGGDALCLVFCLFLLLLFAATPHPHPSARARAHTHTHTHTPLWTSTVKKESPYYFSHASSWGQEHRKGSGNSRTNEGPPPTGRTD